QERLPAGLRCRVEERVVLESPDDQERGMYPDVRVFERPHANGGPGEGSGAEGAGGVAVAEPLILHLPDELATETYLEIIDVATGKRVITIIEVLSHTNKNAGAGQNQYVQKKQELRDAGVSLVEIDFLRQGSRFYPVPPSRIASEYLTTYQVTVRRGWKPEKV